MVKILIVRPHPHHSICLGVVFGLTDGENSRKYWTKRHLNINDDFRCE